jgi:hypothetical protein
MSQDSQSQLPTAWFTARFLQEIHDLASARFTTTRFTTARFDRLCSRVAA